MSILKHQSIRRQVVITACLVLLLLVGAIVWSASFTQAERQAEVRDETVAVATTAAAYLDGYLKGLDGLASALVQHPSVMALDGPACDRLFTALLRGQPLLTDVLLVAPDGSIHGSALPLEDGRVSQPWLTQALRTAKPQVGAFVIGVASGKPSVPLAYPVFREGPAVVGVLGLSIDLTRLQTVFAEIPLPAGSVVTVVDRANRVLVRSRDSERFVGTTGQAIDWFGLPRTGQRIDVDGVERLTGDAEIRRAPWMISVGIPLDVVTARVRPMWRRNLTIAAITVLGLLFLSLWSGRLTSTHLARLRASVQRIADGDLSPPPISEMPNRDLTQLQDAFVKMAANLQEARQALGHQVEQEREMNATLQSLQRKVVRQERLAAVGLLVSGLAHELNNPLQAILGSAELLERHEGLDADALNEVAFVKTQGSRAREIIRNLSRFTSQQLGPPSAVDLRDVVADVMELRARNVGASAKVEVNATSTHKVYANLTELEQVALNFVLNAEQAIESADFGVGRGRIEIRVFDAGRRVRLEVHDNGPGVRAEDEPKLFQPFFTTKPVGQGTGLGLSVSYGIIYSYGGSIGYFQNAWGGATFFFELPALDPAMAPEPLQAESPNAAEMIHDGAPLLQRPV